MTAQTPAKTIKNSFVIHGEVSAEQKKFYTASIESADFEQYRLKTQTVTLKFKNGFLLELLSAKELVTRNIFPGINVNNYTDYAPSINYKYPLFEINQAGWILAEVQINSK